MSPILAVIFDLDGTLLDTIVDITAHAMEPRKIAEIPAHTIEKALKRMNLPTKADLEALSEKIGLGFEQLDAGLGVPAEDVYARAEYRIREIESQRAL